MPDTASLSTLFDTCLKPLTDANVFANVTRTDVGVRCDAMHVQEECYYAAHADAAGNVWAGWYSPDRWVSGSIEGDLVHTGDKIDELLEEELVDLGLSIKLPLEHYRNDDKVFVFHGKVALPDETDEASALLVKVLLAFEACFVELGDMAPGEDE